MPGPAITVKVPDNLTIEGALGVLEKKIPLRVNEKRTIVSVAAHKPGSTYPKIIMDSVEGNLNTGMVLSEGQAVHIITYREEKKE